MSLLKINWSYMLSSCWTTYFVSFICISIFIPIPHCLDYCSFMVSLEISYCEKCNSVFLKKKVWLFCFPFLSTCILESACWFLQKKILLDFDWNCIEYIYINFGEIDILTILTFNLCAWHISPFNFILLVLFVFCSFQHTDLQRIVRFITKFFMILMLI